MQKNTMFKTRKNKGSEFFKSTRIESCSHVTIKGGKAMAVPFIPKKRLTYADRMQKSKETVSLAAYTTPYMRLGSYLNSHAFKPRGNLHAGMRKKPLVKYDPLSYRNRLPVVSLKKPSKNAS